jgi:hypothetical protein
MKNNLSKETIREMERALSLVEKSFENTVMGGDWCD